ncbi:MAG: flippase-like domain-containing protein [Spirochaetes bacterium]|nr:flippase-like domain-containing protein [Spirochaetota bacterium]
MKFLKLNKTQIVFLIFGIIILILLFKSFGIEKFINDIMLLGWRFLIVVSLFLFNNIILSYAWKILINYPVTGRIFCRLILARIAGDSTSSINAIGSVAGDPIKALFMKNHIPFKTALASVVLDRTVHSLSNTLLILTGIICSFFILNLPKGISIGFLIFIVLVCILMLMVLKKQKNGFIEFIINKLPEKLSIKFITEERLKSIREIDKEISIILTGKNNLRRFIKSLAIRYISVLTTGTLEVYLILKFINTDVTLINSMFIYIFTLFLTSIVFFMPANIGTSEASFAGALKFLGYDPAIGLTVGIIQRLRKFIWSGIGMLILFYGSVNKEKEKYLRETNNE